MYTMTPMPPPSTNRFALRWVLVCLAALGGGLPVHADTGRITVFHWWVSGGERASMDTIRDFAIRQGLHWSEQAAPGSGTARYTDVLAAHIRAGKTPTAAQMIGFDIQDWARQGLLENLNDLAVEGEWDEVVPLDIQHLSKWRGQWVAAPFNAHSTNWLWVNKTVADRLGISDPPDDWTEFIALLDKAKAAGIPPIAIGREAWEHTLLFESVAVGVGGAEFYRKAFIDLDPAALQNLILTKIFERMHQLESYLDKGFVRRRWDDATDLVSNGQALLQVQGTWVNGEFTAKGLEPGRDYHCWRFPGTQGVYLFNSDQFVFFKLPASQRPTQRIFATITMTPALQAAVNVRSGAAPARVDVSRRSFNRCGQRNITDMRRVNMRRAMMGSIAMGNANPPRVKTAIYDVVTRHLQGQLDTPGAVAALRKAIEQAAARTAAEKTGGAPEPNQ